MRAVFIDTIGHILAESNTNWCLSLKQTGIDITLITNESSVFTAPDSLPIHYLFRNTHGPGGKLLRGVNYLKSWRRVFAKLDEIKPDVVHFQLGLLLPLDIFFLSRIKKRGAKLVYNAHDILPLEKRFYHKMLCRILYSSANAILVFNEKSKSKLLDLLPQENKITVLPISNYIVPSARVSISQKEARIALGLPEDVKIFLSFGCIRKAKGLDLLLQAMHMVVQTNPKAVLVIAGQVWRDSTARYRKIINDLDIGSNVYFRPGYVPDEDVGKYFLAADCVVFPYLQIYQSASILWAFAYERAVIASNISGLAEWIKTGESGLLVQPGDISELSKNILYLADHDRARLELAKRGQDNWKRLTDPMEIGKTTAAIYEQVIS